MSADHPEIDITRRQMILGGALVAGAAIAYAREPRSDAPPFKKGSFEKLIPQNVGPWQFETASGLVLPPPDALSDRLYDEVVTRVYVSENNPPIMFLVAYSATQDGLLQVHRPEVCYPVGGFQLTRTLISPLQVEPDLAIPVRTFSAASPSRTEQVLYWTRLGADIPTSWAQQRMSVIRANLRGEIPDGILVRISTIQPDMDQAMPYLKKFIGSLSAQVAPEGRKLLFGKA